MSSRRGVMVTVPELAAALAGSAPPALLDVRWTLGEVPGSGRQRYAAGHLPGAAFLDLESALTRHTGDRRDGRHPLPVPAVLRDALAEAGVRAGQQIVVYDEPGSFAAGRAWWVLRWVGLPVRVLDGGLTAWTAAGHPLESGDAEIRFVPASDSLPPLPPWPPLTGGHLPTLSADDAATARTAGYSSTSGPLSGSAARSSRSTRSLGTSRERSTSRSPASSPPTGTSPTRSPCASAWPPR